MPTFKNRFDAMVKTLRAHPGVEVFSSEIRPPATRRELADAEELLGQPLPTSLRGFYEAHNGVFLEWGVKGVDYSDKTKAFQFPDYGQPPGCINLLPVQDAISSDWEEHSHVNEVSTEQQELLFGVVPSPQPPIRAVCIDNFSKYNHADLIIGPEPLVVISTDHGADMDSSDFLPFALYLDVTLAVFGTNRYNALGIGWSRTPQRLTTWDQSPTLDEILGKLEDRHRG